MNPDARLRRALLPVHPPDGFAHRVRARIEQQSRATSAPHPTRGLRYLAAAAVLLAVLGGPLAWREYSQRRQGIAAKAQVLLALQIASRELNSVHRRVVRPTAIRLEPQRSEVLGKEGRP